MLLTASSVLKSANLPAWFQVTGVIFSIIGVLGTAITAALRIGRAPRKTNDGPRTKGVLRTIRRWRPAQFSLALGQLKEFQTRLSNYGSEVYETAGQVEIERSDLYRWLIQQATTCAAYIVPQSLGKANLFRVRQLTYDPAKDQFQRQRRRNQERHGKLIGINVYSSEFVGVFSPGELIDELDSHYIRSLNYTEGQFVNHPIPTSLRCALLGKPILHPVQPRSYLDLPEREWGATHVLGIPLTTASNSDWFEEQPIAITVALQYGKIRSYLISRRNTTMPEKLTAVRRARQLVEELQKVGAFSDRVLNPERASSLVQSCADIRPLKDPPFRGTES